MRQTVAKRIRKLVMGDKADVRHYDIDLNGTRRLRGDTPRWMCRQLKSMYKRGAVKV